MSIPLMMGVAYAVVAALLLTLNLSTPWRREIKLAAISVVTALYVTTYQGAQDLRGWALGAEPPNPFKLHWAIVEEPDKANGTKGAIYILAQPVSELGSLLSAPRLYELPFSLDLAEQVDEAMNEVQNGKPLEGRFSRKSVDTPEAQEGKKRDGTDATPDSRADKDRLKLDFRELPIPDLPAKSAY